MIKTLLVVGFLWGCSTFIVRGQGNPVYSSHYMNPSLYNPSYVVSGESTELFLNYRKQWSGLDGAPSTATLNFQHPFSKRVGIGAIASKDAAGLLTNTTGMVSFGYQVFFGDHFEANHRLAFGLSAGATESRVDIGNADFPDDPAIERTNTTYLSAQFGVNYQVGKLKIGFAIPQILTTRRAAPGSTENPGIGQIKNTQFSLSYEFMLSQQTSFEPAVLYRTSSLFPNQLETSGILRFNEKAWIGGGYRTNYGAFGLLGFTINDQFTFGYAYEFAPALSELRSAGTHEIQLEISLGKGMNEEARKHRGQP